MALLPDILHLTMDAFELFKYKLPPPDVAVSDKKLHCFIKIAADDDSLKIDAPLYALLPLKLLAVICGLDALPYIAPPLPVALFFINVLPDICGMEVLPYIEIAPPLIVARLFSKLHESITGEQELL